MGIALTCVFAWGLCFPSGCALAPRSASQTPSTDQRAAAPSGPSLGDLVPASSLPARDEELWIIEKPDLAARAGADAAELSPGGGMLLNIHGSTLTPLPLEQTDVRGDIDGIIASVDVKQRFTNSSKGPADVVYTF